MQKVYWTAFPRSIVRAGIEALQGAQGVDAFPTAMVPTTSPSRACDDALVTTQVEASEFLEKGKMAALRAHGTQVSVDGGFFALADNVGSRAWGYEFYRVVRGAAAAPYDDDGRETSLLNGLA